MGGGDGEVGISAVGHSDVEVGEFLEHGDFSAHEAVVEGLVGGGCLLEHLFALGCDADDFELYAA